LAIVKHALTKCGARLEIKSRLGEGALFTCIFPK
jgi:signal transduction histidine kinase